MAHLADARGVDEEIALAAPLERAVDGVSRGPRDRRHDRSLCPQEAVEQRRLADVGPAHDRDPQRRLHVLGDRDPRQLLERGVEQVPHALAVLGGDGEHAREPEPGEVLGAVLGPLDLVDGHQHLLAATAQAGRDGLVVGQQPRTAVHHENDQVRLVYRQLGLGRGRSQQRIVGLQQQPARVDQLEGGPLPGRLRVVAVARGAGPAVGDGLAPSADPIEKSRLADVRPADQRDFWDRDHL